MNATDLEKPPSKMDAVKIVAYALRDHTDKKTFIQKLLETRSFTSYVEAEKHFDRALRGSIIYEPKPGWFLPVD